MINEIEFCRWFASGTWIAEECPEQPEEPSPLFEVKHEANAKNVAEDHNALCDEVDRLRLAVKQDLDANNELQRRIELLESDLHAIFDLTVADRPYDWRLDQIARIARPLSSSVS